MLNLVLVKTRCFYHVNQIKIKMYSQGGQIHFDLEVKLLLFISTPLSSVISKLKAFIKVLQALHLFSCTLRSICWLLNHSVNTQLILLSPFLEVLNNHQMILTKQINQEVLMQLLKCKRKVRYQAYHLLVKELLCIVSKASSLMRLKVHLQ